MLLDLEGTSDVDSFGIYYGLAKPISDYSKIGIALTLNSNNRICSFMEIPMPLVKDGAIFEFQDPLESGYFVFVKIIDDSSIQIRRYSTNISVEIYGAN